jgi:hypothetical protein
MGTSRTPKYIVVLTPASTRFVLTLFEWKVKSGPNSVGYGKPTPENLRHYVNMYNASLEPECRAVAAKIFLNDGTYTNPLATWQKEIA